PRGEYQQEVWAQRAGDARVAEDIARALPTRYAFRRSQLYFDAGDFLADGAYVFVAPAVARRNVQHTVATRADLLRALALELKREPVLLDAAPDHHLGMYMMSAGAQTIAVADPSLGQTVFNPEGTAAAGLAGGADFTAATQQHFDAVADIVRAKGFRVVRIPVVPARDDNKVYLTYVNVMLDMRAGQPIVYMPSYAGQERMNAAAQKVWETLGYTVRQIDCTGAFVRGGTLHCLVNVLERESR
ncbi:MAG: agmatine deiminase family protein, partial [Phycisphaerae bacterium]